MHRLQSVQENCVQLLREGAQVIQILSRRLERAGKLSMRMSSSSPRAVNLSSAWRLLGSAVPLNSHFLPISRFSLVRSVVLRSNGDGGVSGRLRSRLRLQAASVSG